MFFCSTNSDRQTRNDTAGVGGCQLLPGVTEPRPPKEQWSKETEREQKRVKGGGSKTLIASYTAQMSNVM